MFCSNLKETSKMAQPLKILDGKPDNLSSFPEPHMVKRTGSLKSSSDLHLSSIAHACSHTYTGVLTISKHGMKTFSRQPLERWKEADSWITETRYKGPGLVFISFVTLIKSFPLSFSHLNIGMRAPHFKDCNVVRTKNTNIYSTYLLRTAGT